MQTPSIPESSTWTTARVTLTANNLEAPDGTTTATLATGTSGSSVSHYFYKDSSIVSGVDYTQSFFVRRDLVIMFK